MTKKGRLSGEGSNKILEGNKAQTKGKPKVKQIHKDDGSGEGADEQKEKRPRKEKAQVTESNDEDIEMCGQGDLKGTSQRVRRPSKCQRNVNNKSVSSLSKHITYGETYICT